MTQMQKKTERTETEATEKNTAEVLHLISDPRDGQAVSSASRWLMKGLFTIPNSHLAATLRLLEAQRSFHCLLC